MTRALVPTAPDAWEEAAYERARVVAQRLLYWRGLMHVDCAACVDDQLRRASDIRATRWRCRRCHAPVCFMHRSWHDLTCGSRL